MFRLYNKINNGGVYIIAEISANHAGKIDNAIKIVNEAAKIGVDCIKIQTYTADTITLNCDNSYFKINGGLWDGYKLYDLYKEAYTPWEWQERIKKECDKVGIDFLSTPFDTTAVDFLENIGVEAYKIASFELVDIPLIEYVASKKKPIIISCGMGSLEEIQEAIKTCYDIGNYNVVLLKCCSEYPSNWKDMHLTNITDMKTKFNLPIGLSDHSSGYLGAVIGVSLGAQVIEKHICLSREMKSPDSEFSMEINEFKEMIDIITKTIDIKGDIHYGPNIGEIPSLKFRKSIFAVKEIKKGDIFDNTNIKVIRPSNGMSPKYMKELLGKKAKVDIGFGEPINKDMIE